jgi:hypothetical protein
MCFNTCAHTHATTRRPRVAGVAPAVVPAAAAPAAAEPAAAAPAAAEPAAAVPNERERRALALEAAIRRAQQQQP